MKTIIHEKDGRKIAEIISDSVILRNTQDALDLMADPALEGARMAILHKKNITPGFFDLSTRLAGEILQKFANYYFKLAIVGDIKNTGSSSLKALIYESNKGREIFFLESVEAAKIALFDAE